MKFNVKGLPGKLAGEIPPVVAIVGNEGFLRREAVRSILERAHGGEPAPEDVRRLDRSASLAGDELTELFDDLRTPSLFTGRQSVVIDGGEPALAAEPDAWISALKHPWAGACLILLLDALDGRTRVARAIRTAGWWIEVKRPFHRPPPWKPSARPWENDLNRWIIDRARGMGLSLDPPTAHLLQTRVGNSLGEIAAALDRIATVLAGKGKITRELVTTHTPEGEESTLFELVDELYLGDRRRSLALAREILRRGSRDTRRARVTDPAALLLQFIGAALSRARQIREVHRTVAAGGGEAEILQNAGATPAFLPRLRRQAQATAPPALEGIITELIHADSALKKGRGPRADELLERLALRIDRPFSLLG
ncbi:MAG: DNA polymerase III subunit delta [Planctomycetota bacterium]